MKSHSDPDSLLDDLMEDAAPPEFRAALLEQTLRQVRHRNRARRLNRSFVVVALFIGVPILFWKLFLPTSKTFKFQAPAFGVVHTQPLNPSLIVQTKLGSANIATSSASRIAFIETGAAEKLFKEINDDQLLALVAGRPVALVRPGPHLAELLFLNPEDQNGFQVR